MRASTNRVRSSRAARVLAVAGLVCALAGCGGGGSASNQAPVASARLVGAAVVQATTRFDSTASSDPDGSIVRRQWDYGDGTTGDTDTHVYAATGAYTATLTVTDNAGVQARATVALTVDKCSADGLALAANSPQHAVVCMQTNQGELVIELFPAQAPVTVANFLKYVDDGFYSGTLFHRAEPGAVIQGGGYTSGMNPKAATYPPIALESANGLANLKYTVAMARGTAPATATSQFFVNLADNPLLNCSACNGSDGYAVFGQVLQTVQADATLGAIAAQPTTLQSGLHIINAGNEVLIRSVIRVP